MKQGKFKLIGYPLSHSLSPFIHERLFQLSKKNSIYDLYEISKQDFDTNVEDLLENDGFNVTIPYKTDIIKHLDKLDEKARLYNAVNTVDCRGTGSNIGYNTDCYGLFKGLEELGTSLSDGPVLLLGAGGAAHMIASETVLVGSPLTIAVREGSLQKAELLRSQLLNISAAAPVQLVDINHISGTYNLLINATPCGMFPKSSECPVTEDVVKNCAYVYDLIYNPTETQLIQLARKNNIPAANGISMLVWQAVYAHKIWYQANFRLEDIEQLITDAQEMVNTQFVSKISDRATQI